MDNLINKATKIDALQGLEKIQDNAIDMIFTDPAYWTLNKWRNIGTTTRLGGNKDKSKQNENEWFDTIDTNYLFNFMVECYRVLKKDRHMFLMCDGQTLKDVLLYSEEAGFNYCKPLVWDKVNIGMGYHFRNQHEFIVMFDKGKNRKPKNMSLSDIIKIPMIRGGYPTEKPEALPKLFIEQFTNHFELILDPFCGSGSTLSAAKKNSRGYIGFDINDNAIDYSNKRLNYKENLLFL